MNPTLQRAESHGVAFWTDPGLCRSGILIAFSERTGGAGTAPYQSLDLAAHVGDDPAIVDANRARFLDAVGVGALRDGLVTAEQVHGERIVAIGPADAGRGAHAGHGRPPVSGSDGLMTASPDIPLLLLFADCVPVILVAPEVRAVSVLHAGWRGALTGIPAKGVSQLVSATGASPSQVLAYVGAHIGPCCYEVGDEILSQFANTFVTVSRAESHLDLGAAVAESLTGAGVLRTNVCRLGACTADSVDRFFSYRAEHGVTGRHGALACVLTGERPAR